MGEPIFECIRRGCIQNDVDAYHWETHLCFVCLAEFEPTSELRLEQCPICHWYKCPTCGGCQCSLVPSDQAWMESVFSTFCRDPERMASFSLREVPDTTNPNVKLGLGIQLFFCKRWAALKLGMCRETDL